MEFSVEAILSYRVKQDTPFVFNVQAQALHRTNHQVRIFAIEPELPTEDWTMPESANRYLRLIAPAGGFKLSYQATGC